MEYKAPTEVFGNVVDAKLDGSLVRLIDQQGYQVEIEKFQNSCWAVELRLDLMKIAAKRQGFTGAQAKLRKDELTLNDNQIVSGKQTLRFSKENFSFQLLENNQVIFDSGLKPFAFHPKPVSSYRGLMSLKVTDFSKRSPFGPEAKIYETQMCTFSCPRPEGTVLGLPGTPGQFDRNGYRFQLYNTDHFMHTPDATLYQSWPILFYKSPGQLNWVGIFFDNPSETFVDVGDFDPTKLSFEAVANNIRVYVATGKSLAEVSQKIVTLIGRPNLLPLWSFGYQQCRWSYMSTNEVRKVAKSLREKSIPCDSIYFDIDYMEKFKVFTYDKENFKDLKECLNDLEGEGFKSVAIVDPGVKVEKGYDVYEKLKSNNHILKNKDGSDFEIVCWPGKAVLPDFFADSTKDFWAELQKKWLTDLDFDGVWNDMNEPSNFDGMNESTVKAVSSTGAVRDQYNLYGYNMADASRRGMLKKNPELRPFVITRSGYPGVQQNAIIWHGDNHAWWEHLRLAIDTCLNYSLCGAYYTGPDVPGFTGNPSDDLAVRFFQLGAFLPFYRGHSIYFAKDKEPYAFSEETNKLIKEAILLRYSLIREWYTGFYLSVKELKPLMAPVFHRNLIVRDQFLLFDKFLVAPVTERGQQYKSIYLPEGDWYQLGNNKNIISGGCYFGLNLELSSIPVFVRAGSIVFRNIPNTNTYQTIKQETLESYPDRHGKAEALWYADDYQSLNSKSELRHYQDSQGKIEIKQI